MTTAGARPIDRETDPLPRDVIRFARRAARRPDPVLILGETGSGKTHLARLIHRLSERAGAPLICVSLGSIAESLFERELFGHVRGAFTDARESAAGLFEAAHGGTLVLDEIGELPLGLQPKLLSVLEDGRVRRLGSARDVAVDVRVIAATNVDLEAMMRERRFRADLFFRLAVLTVRVPPLRERVDQLEAIARILLERSARERPAPRISEAALAALRGYDWPGNIRELDSALRWATTFCDGDVIDVGDLPAKLRERGAKGRLARAGGGDTAVRRYVAPREPVRERDMIVRALREEGGNRARAARRLGMSRATFYTKLLRFGIATDNGHGSPAVRARPRDGTEA